MLYEKRLPDAVTRELLSLPAISAALERGEYPDSLAYLLVEPKGVISLSLCTELFAGAHTLIEQNDLRAGHSIRLPGLFRPHCSSITLQDSQVVPFSPESGKSVADRHHLLMLLLEQKKAPGTTFTSGTSGSSDIAGIAGDFFQGGNSFWSPGYDDQASNRRFTPAGKATGEPLLGVFFNVAALLVGQTVLKGLQPDIFEGLNINDDRLLIRMSLVNGQQQLLRFEPDQAATILGLAAEEGAHSELLWFLVGKGEIVAQSAESVSNAWLLAELNTIAGLLGHAFKQDGNAGLPPGMLSYGGGQSKSGSRRNCAASASSQGRQTSNAANHTGRQRAQSGAIGGSGEPPEDDRPTNYDRQPGEHYQQNPEVISQHDYETVPVDDVIRGGAVLFSGTGSPAFGANSASFGNAHRYQITNEGTAPARVPSSHSVESSGTYNAHYHQITSEDTAPARVPSSHSAESSGTYNAHYHQITSEDTAPARVPSSHSAESSGTYNAHYYQITSEDTVPARVPSSRSMAWASGTSEVLDVQYVLIRLNEITATLAGLSQQVGSIETLMLAQGHRTTSDAATQTGGRRHSQSRRCGHTTNSCNVPGCE